jgi:protein-disulfide isomerase
MNRNFLSVVSTSVLVVCALIVTGLVVRRELFSPIEPAQPRPAVATRPIAGVAHMADTGLVIGAPNARVRILEFSDFQCPFCAAFAASLRQLRHEHPGQITVVWRHLPLTSIHPFSLGAANASECANAQGRFEAFHDALFDHQEKIGVWTWNRFAREAVVPDLAQFDRCVSSSLYAGRVEADLHTATNHNFRSTPTIIVNGMLYDGLPNEAQMQAWLVR